MDLSLDEYIAIKNGNNTHLRDLTTSDEACANASAGRQTNRNDDDVLMINATEEKDLESSKIWKNLENDENEEEVVYTYQYNEQDYSNDYDLRDKIIGNNKSTEMPCINSPNWRMMRPNVNCRQRPSGMPPLVPQHARPMKQKNGSRRKNKRKQFQYFTTNCGKFGNGGWNKGQNVKPQVTSSMVNSNQRKIGKTVFKINMPNKGLTSNSTMTKIQPLLKANNEAVNSCLKNNVQNSQLNLYGLQNHNEINNDMLPQIASKLLDMIRTNSMPVAHKPMYDLTVHKQICEIQKKPFVYKCGSVEVLSSDGPGIEHVKVTPATTPLSLNCRFG